MSSKQPFLYHAPLIDDARFPTVHFDPKAVTRASYAPKPQKPKQEGPLVSFNRHPDAHVVPTTRSHYALMGQRTKRWIRRIRLVQLCLRVLELNAAVAILVLMILFTKMPPLTAWVLRITPVTVTLHAVYAIYHLARPAGGRTPASSAFYHLFSATFDLSAVPIYAFGVVSVKLHSSDWSTLLADGRVLDKLIPTAYYALISAAGLHFVSLLLSSWLAWTFRKITLMPPDMNPLEGHLTSRLRHKRKQSSVATFNTDNGDYGQLSMPLRAEELAKPPSVPFMDTRPNSIASSDSLDSSQWGRPNRTYQIIPTKSPRHSATSIHSSRYSYVEPRSSRTAFTDKHQTVTLEQSPRKAKYTESWRMPESSPSSRYQQQRTQPFKDADPLKAERLSQAYEALSQRYDAQYSSDEELDLGSDRIGRDRWASSAAHPDPLGSNPTSPQVSSQAKFSPPSLSDHPALRDPSPSPPQEGLRVALNDEGRWLRSRNSSIQPDAAFFAKPYGELKAATPPVMSSAPNTERQLSSGNDLGVTARVPSLFSRRKASGRNSVYAYGDI